MVLAYLTFFTGIAISAVAIYYSVLGLAAIFSAAVIPIVLMGTILEVAKLVTAWWLKSNWYRAPTSIKSYLTVSVIILMLITSMGIFGFLSKAHTDQAIPLGDTSAQVSFIDEKINNEREIISNARSLIKQLDDAVIGIQSSGNDREIKLRDGGTITQSSAERALQVRRAQAKDRAALTKQIEESQARIVKLQEEKAPIAGKLRAVEAEVGPIKYIAKLIYGDNPDQNILEKAVVWVIIIIVFVFDPLAVLLLLASQMSFVWARQDKERSDELVQQDSEKEIKIQEKNTEPEPDVGTVNAGNIGQSDENKKLPTDVVTEQTQGGLNDATVLNNSDTTPIDDQRTDSWDDRYNSSLDELARDDNEIDEDDLDYTDLEDKPENFEKKAIHSWKKENPTGSIKRQRKLLHEGFIDELPWQKYLNDYQKNYQNSLARSYLEIKEEDPTRIKPNLTEVIEPEGYIQNSEQNEGTLWKKIQEKK